MDPLSLEDEMDDQKLEVEMADKLIFTYSTTSGFQLNNRNRNARNFFFLQHFYFVYFKVLDIYFSECIKMQIIKKERKQHVLQS